jgi:multidrug resistance efflux pump
MPNTIENINLRSEEVQDILEKVPHWMIRYGNVLFLTLILALLGISWLIKYPDVIISETIITTQIPPQKEYAKTTGKLSAILVQNTQQVKENTPLAIIENSADYKDVFILKGVIDTLEIDSKTFNFPIDELPFLSLGDIESQYALFENNYNQYILNKQLQPFSNEAIATNYSISELKRRLESLQSQKEINGKELAFNRKDLIRSQTLFERGVISAQEYESKQITFAREERNYKNFESSISQIREAISNAYKTSKGTEISRITEEMTLFKSVIQSYNQLKKAIKDWEKQYVLKSSISGQVSFLSYWSINQTVNQGDIVFTIIPSESSSFVAKLKVPALNSGKVRIGQEVHIKLQNYPETEFGVLNGQIENISLFPEGEEGVYLADVQLPQKLITSYKKEIDFKQEMKGYAEIITEDLRLIERFFYQLREVLVN